MSENTASVEEKTTIEEEQKEETTDSKTTEQEQAPVEAVEKKEEKAEDAKPAPAPEVKPEEKKPFFHFGTKKDALFSRDEWILQNIKAEDMMEYLQLEYKRMEFLQNMKEIRSKRILRAFELTVCLAAVVAMTYFLKDNPTILISVLYTLGIISVFWIWKHPKDKK